MARPRTTVFRLDTYPDVFAKAAAFLQFLARNHPLIDGNKRTARAAAWTFLYTNGIALGRFDVDDAEVFIIDVATRGDLDLEYIASKLTQHSRGRSGVSAGRRYRT